MAQEDNMNYEKMKKKAGKLVRGQKYDEAIAMYEEALREFPGKFYPITFSLAQLYMSTGNPEKSLNIFETGLKKKIMYPIWTAAPYWKPLFDHDAQRFKKILDENRRLQAEKTAEAKPGYKVIPPAKYSREKKYPLFFVLHGWNESMTHTAKYWQSKGLNKNFLVVLTQSSQVVSPSTFGWEDNRSGKKDIKEIFEKISAGYPVDTDHIIIAGFSQGGMLAMDIAVNQIVPACGFVLLHPGGGLPADFNLESVKKAAGKGLSGTIIMSEQNKSGEEIDKVREILKAAGFDYRFVVSGAGHWYPADFSKQLDAAVTHIADKKK
jgi:predicted esterase